MTKQMQGKPNNIQMQLQIFGTAECFSPENVANSRYDDNLAYIQNTAAIMSRCQSPEPNLQLKITAFMPANVVVSTY